MVEVTEDGRWIVVNGRRWRATDPSIPESLRKQLVAELMHSRRAVGAARRAEDADAERAARARVQRAKVALGERGEPWWEERTDDGLAARIDATTLTLAAHRSPEKTICPSDAARAIGGEEWRALMPLVRDRVRALARDGLVEVLQGGRPADPEAEWRGPIRVRHRPGD